MKKSYIFVLIFMFNEIICHLKAPVFKCQHFDNEEKNKLPTRTSKGDINQNEAHKRRVDAETDKNGYKDFNIYLDLENIKYEISNMNLEVRICQPLLHDRYTPVILILSAEEARLGR